MSDDELELNRNLVRRLNIGDTLTRSAARNPQKLALVDGDRRWTYKQFNDTVNRLANVMTDDGFERGDAVGLMSGNSAEFLFVYYACAKLGVVCVPINLSWGASETKYVLEHSKAVAIFVESQLRERAEEAAGELDVWPLPGIDGTDDFDIMLDGQSAHEPGVFVDDRDALSYLYTSGTTSAPKGVVGSHTAIYVGSMSAAIDNKLTDADRMAAMMPFFHTAQLNAFITPCVLTGGTIFCLRAFEPATLLELVEREQLTQIFGLPMMYRAMLDHPDVGTRDLSSLRLAFYAMAPMPDDDLRRCLKTFDCDFALLFGQTEMSPITTVFRPEHQLSHTGAVGTPAASTQVAIMDPEGNLLPQGESGEIVYRGPNALEEYLYNEEATEAVFKHGWFHSGDVGHFDADGVLWFADRVKDVIKSGGENVASIEVEKALYAAVPAIQEVVVIGLPHARWTEAITAICVPREGQTIDETQVIAAVREHLSGFKTPKAIVVKQELPRTSTGKVQKNVLREELASLYDDRAPAS